MNHAHIYVPKRGEIYRALSVQQPWASMIVFGMKTIEKRTTNFHHRGPILIHASTRDSVSMIEDLDKIGMSLEAYRELPRGCYIGIATLKDVKRRRTRKDGKKRYGLELGHPRFFRKPVVAPGELGVYLPSAEVWRKIRKQIMELEY